MAENKVISTFEIPEELAQELSKLLTTQSIRERVLVSLANEPEKYVEFEEQLIPIVQRIEHIKFIITSEYVPAEYSNENYMWNYDGWEINKNIIQVLHA